MDSGTHTAPPVTAYARFGRHKSIPNRQHCVISFSTKSWISKTFRKLSLIKSLILLKIHRVIGTRPTYMTLYLTLPPRLEARVEDSGDVCESFPAAYARPGQHRIIREPTWRHLFVGSKQKFSIIFGNPSKFYAGGLIFLSAAGSCGGA